VDLQARFEHARTHHSLRQVTTMLSLHQVVRVIRDVPQQGVIKGMVGAVIEIFEIPEHAYEVEFVDAEGRTLLEATLMGEDLQAVDNSGAEERFID
jgi:hypothetical protein